MEYPSLSSSDDSASSSSLSIASDPDYVEGPRKIRQEGLKESSTIKSTTDGREKYYYFGRNNCWRKKFHYCGDCPYRAYHKKPLISHAKKLHPSSTTALPPPRIKPPKKPKRKSKRLDNISNNKILNDRHHIAKFGCSQCEFRTNFPHRMKRHKELHKKKSDHQCSLCSYSAKRKRDVYAHMKSFHKSNSNKDEEWFYPSNGKERVRIHSCGDCEYKTKQRSCLVKHVEKAHPSSASALPPAPPTKAKPTKMMHQCTECEYKVKEKRDFERHRLYHDEKSAFKCPHCSFSLNVTNHLARHVRLYHTKIDPKALASEKQASSVPAPIRTEQWHYFPNGIRKRYKLCGDCDYKSTTNFSLDMHIKLMHPFSTTALQPPPTTNLEKDRFRCAHCQFKTSFRLSFERHDACHRNKSAKHRCHLCSYSVHNYGHLSTHLVLHHRGENINNNKTIAEKDTSQKSRRYILSCQDCDLFKTTSLFTLKKHVKRAHPFSLTALPRRKSGLKPSREEWYTPLNGNRARYIYCGDCSYRTVARSYMKQHAELMHPSSKTAVPAKPPKKGRRVKLNCSFCNYSTTFRNLFLRHQAGHKKKLEHQCTLCSYSCSTRSVLGRHLIHDHGGTGKNFWRCSMCNFKGQTAEGLQNHEALHLIKSTFQCHLCSYSINNNGILLIHLARHHSNASQESSESEMEIVEEVPSDVLEYEARLRKQFGIKECRVILRDICSPKIYNGEKEDVLPSKEADQVGEVELEDGKIQLLQNRKKALKERARIIEEEVKDISSKQMDLQKRIIELAGRKVSIEYDLRSEQCNLLELNLSLIESEDDNSEMIEPAEEKIKNLEEEMNTIDTELGTLKDEEKSLAQDLINAQGSHIGVVQVLEALQLELDGLLSFKNSV